MGRSDGRWPHLLTLLVLSLGANFCMNCLVAAEPIQNQDMKTSPKMVIDGVVYCETPYNLGSDSSRLAAHHVPLKDATVKVECNNRWARATEFGKTDAQGMFSISLQNYDYEVWGAKGCQAKLVSSSHASCTTPTNMSGGLVGTKLAVKNRSKDKVTLSAGPFAFKQATVGSKSQERKLMEGTTKSNSPELWYSPPYDQSPNYESPPYYDNNHHNSHGSDGHGDQGRCDQYGNCGGGGEQSRCDQYGNCGGGGEQGRCDQYGNCGGGGSGYGNSHNGHRGSSEHRGDDDDRDGHRGSSGRDCSPGYEGSHHRSGGYYGSPPPYYDHHNSGSRHHSSPYYQSPPYNTGGNPPSPYYYSPPEYHSPHSSSNRHRNYSPSPEYHSPRSSSNHHGEYSLRPTMVTAHAPLTTITAIILLLLSTALLPVRQQLQITTNI